MVAFYVRRILARKMAIEDVPEKWYAQVREALINEYVARIRGGMMTLDDVPESLREDVRKALENE